MRFHPSRRELLLALPSLAAISGASAAAESTPGLKDLAARQGRLYGAAAATYQLADRDFAAVLAREAAIIVPEYELKRFLVEPSPGHYDFSAAETLSAFAASHGLLMRGHPLVWHAANPPWLEQAVLSSRKEALLSGYVTAVASRFRGRMHSWDVVNEALEPSDGMPGGFRNSFWFKAFGPGYVELAFRAARAADPSALLVYNDFGCEAGMPANDLFRARTLSLLEQLLKRNVPVDAYGMQGHLSAYGPGIDPRKLGTFLAEIEAMGLRLIVTEHDVDDAGGPSDTVARDRAVADASQRFLDVVLERPALIGVLTWGLSDRYLRAEGMRASLFETGLRKLPLDRALVPTPLYRAMSAAFRTARPAR
ncbi:MAG: endo-1,4-beta-xylanase [Alphaproteobacteria bacterium]|nr:endo-1,4-beta-xylanase [Alphaproteobacteria bacterium]